MGKPASNVTEIKPRITQRRLRMIAFARVFAETMDSGQAFRDVYRPAENPHPTDRQRGESMLRLPFVQKHVGEVLRPTLVALGVDQTFAIRRLIETIDGDLTDYMRQVPGTDTADIMTLTEMREALPLAKRRLVKKYKVTYDQYGGIKSREIELEPKQGALELLAKIKGWIKADAHIHIDGDEMLRKIDEARHSAVGAAEVIRGEFTTSRTFAQLNRPTGTAVKQLPPPDKNNRG